ncbi:MAG: hypothetical protein QW625_03145 [Candidatus Nanoarchaeia archaeon]
MMPSLLSFAKDLKDLLKPYGEIDVLLLYAICAEKAKRFLKGKEIASKIWLPKGNVKYFLNRGSKKDKLFVEDLIEAVTPGFLELRSKHHLKDVEKDLSEKQKLVWSYFPPRKLADFFYATNCEGVGKPIDRIFFDMDRGSGFPLEKAQEATKVFCEIIMKDKELLKLIGNVKPFVAWTGNSFHVYIILDKPKPNEFYEKYFMYSKKDPLASFTGRWAEEVKKEIKANVSGGHEKIPNVLSIDPSQTPSGKLARVPLGSLHMADAKTINGVSIPIDLKDLENPKLTEKLTKFGPNELINDIEKLGKLLPI